jgi:two-component system cell cycle sensor histidine kinase/response regulator CckA
MDKIPPTIRQTEHAAQVKELVQRLVETEATLVALTGGQVDGIVDPEDAFGLLLREVQAHLQESEARYRAIFELESDAIFLIDNLGGEILEANIAATKLYGYSHDELLALHNTDLSAQPEETRRSTAEQHISIPTRYHRKRDGVVFPVEITANHIVWQNRPCHIAAIRDITERTQTQEALRVANAYNRGLLETSLDPLIAIGWDGKITDVNAATEKVTGFTRSELIGADFSSYCTEPARAMAGLSQVFQEGQFFDYELEIRHRTGAVTSVLFNASVYRGEAGNILGVFAAARDITARKQTEETLNALRRMESLARIAGAVTHEVSNQMTALTLQTGIAREKLEPASAAAAHLDKCLAIAERIATLTTQLRLYTGKAWHTVSSLDLSAVIGNNHGDLAKIVPASIELQLELAAGLPHILADRGQVEQIVTNLVTNAVEAVGERPGVIRIVTASRPLNASAIPSMHFVAGVAPSPGAYVCLTVRDDGEGIAEKNLARIWEPFYSTRSTGRGLGLATVFGIVRAMDGGLQVDSTPGLGSSFTVWLPATGDL